MDRDEEESETLSPRRVVNYYQNKNGNGDVNKIVWAVAGVLTLTLLSLCGVVASKVWDVSERVARIEATLTILVNKQ